MSTLILTRSGQPSIVVSEVPLKQGRVNRDRMHHCIECNAVIVPGKNGTFVNSEWICDDCKI